MLKKIFLVLAFCGLNIYAAVYRRYEYKCTTTGKIVREWRDATPTVCLENPAHTIDFTTLKVIDFKEVCGIITTRDQGATQGIYKPTTFVVNITDAKAISLTLALGAANIGDKISLTIAQNMLCWAVVGNAVLGKVTRAVTLAILCLLLMRV